MPETHHNYILIMEIFFDIRIFIYLRGIRDGIWAMKQPIQFTTPHVFMKLCLRFRHIRLESTYHNSIVHNVLLTRVAHTQQVLGMHFLFNWWRQRVAAIWVCVSFLDTRDC